MNTLAKALAATMIMASPLWAGGHEKWSAVQDESVIAFGSIKGNDYGEVNSFEAVTGQVNEKGNVTLSIALSSLETNIDIRNERIIEHIFKATDAVAQLNGQIDFDQVHDLKVGETTNVDFEGVLSFVGVEADVEAELFVARLAQDRVLVTTANMIMLSTEDLGMTAGIDKLKELASLDSITRVTPVTVRMVLEK